jgi:hypothetical protein
MERKRKFRRALTEYSDCCRMMKPWLLKLSSRSEGCVELRQVSAGRRSGGKTLFRFTCSGNSTEKAWRLCELDHMLFFRTFEENGSDIRAIFAGKSKYIPWSLSCATTVA